MSTKRMLIAFVVALVVLNVYDWLVFAYALRDFHAQFPRWLKPTDQLPALKMFLTGAFNTAVVTLFYALFARAGAARLSTGVVYGVLLGLIAGWVPQATNRLLLVDYPFYPMWAFAIFGEYLLVGIVLGLVYREQ
jgi:hypothetical protein